MRRQGCVKNRPPAPGRCFDGVVTVQSERRQDRRILVTVAVVAPVVVGAVLALFRETITTTTAALVFVLVVVALASAGSRVAGVAAALSSAVWFDFFLTEPYQTFAITDPDDVEIAVLLLLIGVAVSEIALWGRRQQARASRREGYLDGVLRIAGLATEPQVGRDAITAAVADDIVEVLDVDAARYVRGDIHDPRVPLLGQDGRVTRNQHQVNVEVEGLPTDSETALAVRHGGVTTGHFLLTASTRIARPSIEQRKVAVLLANQVAAEPTTTRTRPGVDAAG